MTKTTNLKLKKPDGADTYNVEDMNDNSDILDSTINELQSAVNAAQTAADAAVTTAKLADAAVTTAKIADGAITTAKLADEAGQGVLVAATYDEMTAMDVKQGTMVYVAAADSTYRWNGSNTWEKILAEDSELPLYGSCNTQAAADAITDIGKPRLYSIWGSSSAEAPFKKGGLLLVYNLEESGKLQILFSLDHSIYRRFMSGSEWSEWHRIGSSGGGFYGGIGAASLMGGAVGYSAYSVDGFAGGDTASADSGGAVGDGAKSTSGGAMGLNSSATEGGAVGAAAYSKTGFAGGASASAAQGGAIGAASFALRGGAVGDGAKAQNGFAGGQGAICGPDAQHYELDNIQLGKGINANEKTLQVYDYQMMDANGHIPKERVPDKLESLVVSALPSKAAAYNFEDQASRFVNGYRTACTAEAYETDSEYSGYYQKISVSGNSNTYRNATLDCSDVMTGAASMIVEFDASLSGRWQIGLADLSQRPGASTGSSYTSEGCAFSIGTKDGSTLTVYGADGTVSLSGWKHVKAAIDFTAKTVTYTIASRSDGTVLKTGTIDFRDTTVTGITGFEAYVWSTTTDLFIDNIEITSLFDAKENVRYLILGDDGNYTEYEYINGEPVAFSGGKIADGTITWNMLSTELQNALTAAGVTIPSE